MFLYFLFIVTFQFVIGDDLGRTPLCDKCHCVNKTFTHPDVVCNETTVLNFLYNETYWLYTKDNQTNLTYNIASVNLQNNNLVQLTQQFVHSNLVKLDLSHNSLYKLGDGIFKNLTSLEILILSYNQLATISQHVFKGDFKDGEDYPLTIKTLKLDNNELHTLDPDIFEHIERHLINLYLNHNPFKVIDQNTHMAITSIYNLEILDLSHTQIKELPDNFFHTPKYLKFINLSGNKFKSIPKSLEDTHALEVLNFNDNPIESLTSTNGFPVAPTIKTLHMSHMNDLEYIEKGSMSGLKNLKELYLSNNIKLKMIDAETWPMLYVETKVWPPIEKLFINNNQLTHLDSSLLAHWDRLKEMDLRNNPWTCECENQWMLQLMKNYVDINETQAKELTCAAPIEMEGKLFYDLYKNGTDMRCLDLYGNRPEKDGQLLIGMLVGLLIGIPVVLFFLYAYQKKFFGLFDNSPGAFSRRFYTKTNSGEF